MSTSNLRLVIIAGFGPPSLAIIRSMGQSGAVVGMVAIQSQKSPLPRSKFLSDAIALPRSLLFKKKGIDIIKKFLERHAADGILCIEERVAIWLRENERCFPAGVNMLFPPLDSYHKVLSKKNQNEAAAHAGLNLLPTYYIEQADSDIPKRLFPICLRPSDPTQVTPSFKVKIFPTNKKLNDFLRQMSSIKAPLIAQPFKSLPNLVIHGCRTGGGKTFNMEAFIVERKYESVTLFIRHVNSISILNDRCVRFLECLNITGNFHFEFLIDPASKETWFLEINNRFGGTTAKVYYAEYDEPLYALMAHDVNITPKNYRLKKRTVSSKTALLKYLCAAFTNKLSPLDYPEESKGIRIFNALWGLANHKDDIFDWQDLKGSFSLYYNNLREKL